MKTTIPKRLEVDLGELQSILAEVKDLLKTAKYKILESAVKMIVWLQGAVKEKSITIAALKRLFFSKDTENLKNVKRRAKTSEQKKDQTGDKATVQEPGEANSYTTNPNSPLSPEERKRLLNLKIQNLKKKGHGRRPLNSFDFAKITCIMHDKLAAGSICPTCGKGKVYDWEPETILVFKGQPPIKAEAHSAPGFAMQ